MWLYFIVNYLFNHIFRPWWWSRIVAGANKRHATLSTFSDTSAN